MTNHTPIYHSYPWSTMNTASIVPNGGYSICTSSGNWGTITNTGTLTTSGTITLTAISNTSFYNQSSAFMITGPGDKPLLTINYDGTIEWSGSLNTAVNQFLNTVSFNLDKQLAKETVLLRTYRRALERCLRQIKSMDKEEFISLLELEIDNRLGKEVLLILSEEDQDAG